MSKLYFIRHAESIANKNRVMASRLPYPLTEDGLNDSRVIANELKDIVNINRILSSPLIRAKETAEAFGTIYNLDIEIDPRISEQELGLYSGMTYDEVKTYPQYETDSLKRWKWKPDGGGESYSDISIRLLRFFKDLEIGKEENILIVTHAVTFRLIKAILENTLPNYPLHFPNNGEIWITDFKGVGIFHEIKSLCLGNSELFIHNP